MNEHRKAVEQELTDLLVEKIGHYADFDQWLRDEDPDTLDYAYDLVESLASFWRRPLSLSDRQHDLEARWTAIARDMAEEYAQGASYEAQFSRVRPYADRRGW